MAQRDVARTLLETHGRTYAHELGIDLEGGSPAALFQMLVAALLFSARINADLAVSAAKALTEAGWTTPERMADATWEQRTRTLNESGYARYDERTSAMLGDTSAFLLDRYDGDLRRLRDEAGRDPGRERARLKECKGLGDVGVDIFFREAQVTWQELLPFADKRALSAADQLGLPADAEGLAGLVDRGDVARLVAALVRTELAKDHDRVRSLAGDEQRTKKELYDRAKELDVSGRSSMTKDELATQIARHDA